MGAPELTVSIPLGQGQCPLVPVAKPRLLPTLKGKFMRPVALIEMERERGGGGGGGGGGRILNREREGGHERLIDRVNFISQRYRCEHKGRLTYLPLLQ